MNEQELLEKLEELIESFEFVDNVYKNSVNCTIKLNDIEYIYNQFEFKKVDNTWK